MVLLEGAAVFMRRSVRSSVVHLHSRRSALASIYGSIDDRIRNSRNNTRSSSSSSHANNERLDTPATNGTLCIDNMVSGAWAELETRSFSQTDVDTFATLTGDHNPVHKSNSDNNSEGQVIQNSKAIVHGLLGASLIPALVAACLPGVVYMSQDLKFRQSISVNETVRARVVVTKVRRLKGKGFAQINTFVESPTSISVTGSKEEEMDIDVDRESNTEWSVKIEGKAVVILPEVA